VQLQRKKRLDLFVGGLTIFFLKPLVVLIGKALRRSHDLQPRGRVLVMKLIGGGSLLLAYPALVALKEKLATGGELVIVTTPAVVPFARELKIFDRIYVINDRNLVTLLWSTLQFLTSVVFRVDTCIDLEIHSRGTTLLSLLTLARNRLGFFKETVHWRLNLYTHLVFYNTYSCSADFYSSLISLMGIPSKNFDQASLAFRKSHPVTTGHGEWSLSFACSDHARERQLTPQQWTAALQKVGVPENTKMILLGSRNDFQAGELLKKEIEKTLGLTCHNECGAHALSETIRRIGQSQRFLGIDSGLLHLARLLGKDTVSFWGPTDPGTRLMPRNSGEDLIFYNKVSCSPCVHFADTPPCQGKNLCISAIFASEISHQQRSWAILAPHGQSSVEIKNG
jgi:ADP-heptose:LPS heptosyltransferase